jgi:hypothetical protein
MGVFQKKKALFIGLIELVFPEGLIADDIDPKEVEGFPYGLIHLGGILNDRCSSLDSGNFFYLEKNLFGKASSERGDLKIGLSGDIVY